MLADAADSIRSDMAHLLSKAQLSVSDPVRYAQMATVRRAILEQQAQLLRQLGRVVEARRLEASARAIQLGNAMDAFVLDALGQSTLAREVLTNLQFGLARTTDVALARMGFSYTDLAQRIYRNDVWLGSRIDQRINSLLAQGKTAREFAAEAVDWFNPNTPGGVRYAATRLARSEINNAFHAVSVQQAQDKPWVTGMRWYLSGSHPRADVCDEFADEDKFELGKGIWPKDEVPRKPHPHCFCYVAPVQLEEDAFLENLVNGNYNKWLDEQRALATAKQPEVPTPRSVSGGIRGRTSPPSSAPKPTPAMRAGSIGRARASGVGAPAGLTPTQLETAKRIYGDFTRDVRLLDAMRVPDLKALAKTYQLPGASSQTRPVLLRRLKAKISKGNS
jgi:hypothetical protein